MRQDHGVHCLDAARRFAQWSCRQQQPVAEAARRVDHRDLIVARQPQVLQTVVTDDDPGTLLHGEPGGRDTVGADHDHLGTAARMQQCLVTHFGRVVGRDHDPRRSGMAGPVAAHHDSDPMPAQLQLAPQPERHRRLACSADGEIPDNDDWYRYPLAAQDAGAIEPATQRDQQQENEAQRPERQAEPRGPVPDPLHDRLEAHSLNCMR